MGPAMSCGKKVTKRQSPPDEKRPPGAVPQSAEQHGDEKIAITPEPRAAAAAEGYVKIVPKKPRQRHVPAPPKVGDVPGLVR